MVQNFDRVRVLALVALLVAAGASAQTVTITGNLAPEQTIEGFNIFTLTADSTAGGIVAFDFEGDLGVADDRGIFGPMNNISPFGLPTVFSNNNPAINASGQNVLLDTQFLFNGTGLPFVTVPDGFANEGAGSLRSVFASPSSLGTSVDFARVVLPVGTAGEFRGVVVAGPSFDEFAVSGVIEVPEPTTAGLLGLASVLMIGRRRRKR